MIWKIECLNEIFSTYSLENILNIDNPHNLSNVASMWLY